MSAESIGKTIGTFVKRHPLVAAGGGAFIALVLSVSAIVGSNIQNPINTRPTAHTSLSDTKSKITTLVEQGESDKALLIAEAQGLTEDADIKPLLAQEVEQRKMIRAEKAVVDLKKELALYRPGKSLADLTIGDVTKMDMILGHIQVANHPEYKKLRSEFEMQRNRFIELKENAGDWTYHTEKDELTNKEEKMAAVVAEQELHFDFPYNGGSTASIVLRKSPRHGNDVMLQVSKGQFLCGYDGCSVAASFDGGTPITFAAVGPSDQSNTVIFIRNYNKFVSALKRSNKIVLAAEFYQEGAPNMTFKVGGLNWQ